MTASYLRTWIIAALMIGTLLFGSVQLLDQQERVDRMLAQSSLAQDLKLLAQLAEDEAGKPQADFSHLLEVWGTDRADTQRIRVMTPAGVELGAFAGPSQSGHTLTMSQSLVQDGRQIGELSITKDVEWVLQNRKSLSNKLLIGLLITSLFLAMVIFLGQHRLQLSERLNQTHRQLLEEARNRQQAEAALSLEKESAETALEAIGDAIFTTDVEGIVVRMNSAAARMSGWPAEEICGQSIGDCLHLSTPHGSSIHNPALDALRHDCEVQQDHDVVLTARNHICYQVAARATPIHDIEGNITGCVLTLRDVTLEQRMQRAIRDSESKYRRLLEGLDEHFLYSRRPDGVFEYASPSLERILGYRRQEMRSHFREFLSDNPANDEVATYLEAGSCGQAQPSFQVEVRRQDGSLCWLEVKETPVFASTGQVVAVEGIAHDITERKAVEEREQLSLRVFEESPDSILVTDENGVILRTNPAFTAITGYSADEAIGQTTRFLKSERHDRSFYVRMWTQLLTQGKWSGEVWNRRKNGDIYPQWLSISAVTGPDDTKPRYFIGMGSDIGKLKSAQEQIRQLAFHDTLTGLPNRTLLLDTLRHSLARALRHDHVDAVLFLDLDHFKNINDTLGHSIGDSLLKEVANRLESSVRTEDTVARIGGDEFVVLLPELDNDHNQAASNAQMVAEKIRRILSRPYRVEGHELHTSPSIGIALLPSDAHTAEDALKHADQAMYRAKAGGRNDIQFFMPEMQADAEKRLALETELRKALPSRQLAVYYQPLFDIQTRELIGAEALLRWQHPVMGMISPAEFIPIAEDSGLILPIGDWVLREVCRQNLAWQAMGLQPITVAVNLSPVQFSQPNLTDKIATALRDTGLPAEFLQLEMTESLLMDNSHNSLATLDQLRAMGIKLSIDDFGTGYSSLSYIRRFKLDKLKIDRSFVQDVLEDPEDAAITTTIIQMARNLNLRTVAEGVETEAQLAFLKDQGCDQVQGFLLGRPVPAVEFIRFLDESHVA